MQLETCLFSSGIWFSSSLHLSVNPRFVDSWTVCFSSLLINIRVCLTDSVYRSWSSRPGNSNLPPLWSKDSPNKAAIFTLLYPNFPRPWDYFSNLLCNGYDGRPLSPFACCHITLIIAPLLLYFVLGQPFRPVVSTRCVIILNGIYAMFSDT